MKEQVIGLPRNAGEPKRSDIPNSQAAAPKLYIGAAE
jgi:hypothetical protein